MKIVMSETEQITMRLLPQTIEKIATLQANANLVNRADAVRLGIELGLIVTNAIRSGAKVLIEAPDGSVERVVVPQMLEDADG